jgi:hypothetical protein
MTHIDERTLERLLNHKMSTGDIDVVLSHAAECRNCGHRLEEWRDHFEEIATLIPETAEQNGGQMVLPSAFVLVPDNPSPRTRFELTNLLWVAAVALALIVGYSASRLQHRSSDGLGTSSMAGLEPLGESPQDPSAPNDSSRPVTELPAATVDSAHPVEQRPAPVPIRADTTPAAPASLGASRPRETSVSMPGFRRSALGEASQHLGGGIRFLSNLTPDHVEIGPGSAVPGAQGQLDVVRVVYLSRDGSRILLDQQRIPIDESGFRPINDAALENGDTLIGSSAQGVSVATWVDDDGYRMSLAIKGSPDSLRRMVRRVH